MIVGSLFFFSTIILISELGYVASLEKVSGMSDEDFTNEFNSRNEIAQVENTIWYSLISMTTIGYGDMSVSVSLSRIVVVILSIASAVFFPLFIVTVENLLEFGYQEKMSYQIFKLMGVKEEMKEAASLLMQKNLKRLKLINRLFQKEKKHPLMPKKDKTSIGEIKGSEEDFLNNEKTKANIGETLLDPEEEKEIAYELEAVQAEIFELSRNFKNLRIDYRNNLFTDFHTETNLVLMLLNEYMEGLTYFLEYHMKNREIHPERYPSEKDFKNYHTIMKIASKPKTTEDRYYLLDLVENEYFRYWKEGKIHEKEDQEYFETNS